MDFVFSKVLESGEKQNLTLGIVIPTLCSKLFSLCAERQLYNIPMLPCDVFLKQTVICNNGWIP